MYIMDMWVEWYDPTVDEANLTRLLISEARAVNFEDARPVRAPDGYKQQRNISGFFSSAKSGRLLYFESLREMQALTLMEFDPRIASFSTQPMVLAVLADNRFRRLVPDVFVRDANGEGRLVEVKTSASLRSERVQERLALTAAACERLGLDYRVETEPESVLWRNVKWLSAYRRPVDGPPALARAMEQACSDGPRFVRELLKLGPEWFSRPLLFHLLWHRRLDCDLTKPLRNSTLVTKPRHHAGAGAAGRSAVSVHSSR
jgi:hypothetical protein